MHYKESKEILEEVKMAKRIVLFCHEGPDIDSIASCLLVDKVLRGMGKEVDIFSKDEISSSDKHLNSESRIKIQDPNDVDMEKYDTLFALDVDELHRLGFDPAFKFDGTVINIDHHGKSKCTDISIFERDAGSTTSVLYQLFKDWEIELDQNDLDLILLGVVADTDIFRFPYKSSTMNPFQNSTINI